MPCEYLAIERMEKWIYFGYLLCHGSLLSNAEATQSMSRRYYIIFKASVAYVEMLIVEHEL